MSRHYIEYHFLKELKSNRKYFYLQIAVDEKRISTFIRPNDCINHTYTCAPHLSIR